MLIEGRTDTGRVREVNQDQFAVRADLSLAILADGMGGTRAGGMAAEIAVEATVEHLAGVRKREPLRPPHLGAAAKLANERVVGMSNAISAYRGMGTTLVITVVADGEAAIAHVGDSRAYRLRSGRLQQITKDHSLVQEGVDAGAISLEEARHAPNRNVITRAIGAKSSVQPDVTEIDIASGDILLLCSDGLTGMVSDEDIAGMLCAETDLGQAAERLVDAANRAGGIDNITVVLIRC